ncbi:MULTISPECIES: prepilin peptidase [Selenomonas]|uniref:Prepilin peptidase n=1 Tax=Selenomonas ruminis TaxID=2593411 RepID=A0A5D6VZ90_9FIRM|nr:MULTISPECIES: A24 family peptidase [unclassified Selenomonas]MBQ1867443.1 prepilin peptidase [Selenomonas sp.]TYZ19744.1 prepilin peptidase [Selenomonas sp. mPRGC5]
MMREDLLFGAAGLWFVWRLWNLALLDLRCGLLYDRLILIVALSAVYPWLLGINSLDDILAGGLAGSGLLWGLRWGSHGGMGLGDVKLAGAMGLWLGLKLMAVALVLAFLLGGIVAAGLMVWRGYSCTSKIPFGPFLVFGGCFSYWCGMECWQWYERLL